MIEQTRGPCEKCKDELKKLFGCPFIGFMGKGRLPKSNEDLPEEFRRTCPEYYARIPVISGLYGDLSDYRRGAFGNVRKEINNVHLSLLKILDAESESVKAYLEESLLQDD